MDNSIKADDKVKELLKPRYKVIADYPGSPFDVNEIIHMKNAATKTKPAWVFSWFGHDGEYTEFKSFFDQYPHLFKLLAWYEEREASEMPDYLKDKDGVYEMKDYGQTGDIKTFMVYDYQAQRRGSGWSILGEYALKWFDPATESEYTEYLKQKQ